MTVTSSNTDPRSAGAQEDSLGSIVRLIYVSIANADLNADDVVHILDNAKRRNEVNGLTGMLLFDEGQFWQVLEGEALFVQRTYERICLDKRHTNITTLSFEENIEPKFKDFSMGHPVDLTMIHEPVLSETLKSAGDSDKDAAKTASDKILRGFQSGGKWRGLLT
ncbi:hypothetical protein BVC71_11285 [Marivivens niveibacter]|uniref:BLUF domain-containing protein n=1 Tax=Marivivens niveibacter TaxID=1930667 RepID=A0A251WY18_9RHOB|nr:BLUF domain-containing protein [Marivivens niveibacter]OUD09272.1 hypothetical protein BVC71_11285 [Marivivens niveibacter]